MILSKIKNLCKKRNLTITNLERNCNLTIGSIRYWDKNLPSYDKLLIVAKYFNTTLDYICNDNNTENPYVFTLNDAEQLIIETFRKLSDTNKGCLIGYATRLSEEQNALQI